MKTLKFIYSLFSRKHYNSFYGEIIYSIIVILLFFISYRLNGRIIRMLSADMPPLESYFVYGHFLSLFLFILFTIAILSSIIYLFEILFYDKEIPFLFSLPITKAEIFFNRYIKSYMYGSILFLVFCLGALFSINNYYEPGWSFILISFIGVLFTAVTYISIAYIIVLAFLKIFGSVKTRKFLISFSVFLLSALIILFRYIKPERFLTIEDGVYLNELLESFKIPVLQFFPTEFIKNIFYGFIETDNTLIFSALGSSVILALILTAISYKMFINIYSPVFLTQKNQKNNDFELKLNKNDSAGNVLKKKELTLFIRNNVNFQQMWLFAGLIIVFIFNIYFLRELGDKLLLPVLYLNTGVVLLIIASFLARIFFGLFSENYEEIQFLKTLPIKPSSILDARIKLFFGPLILFGLFISIIMLILYSSNPVLWFLTFFNIVLISYFMMHSSVFFSNYFMRKKFSIFSLPVQIYIILNLFVGFFILGSQLYFYAMMVRGMINSGRFIIFLLIQGLVLFFGANLFYKKAVKKITGV
ncbi:MAG: putative ABC transporter permease subunit [Candidatus Muiribacteriota bacterium]